MGRYLIFQVKMDTKCAYIKINVSYRFIFKEMDNHDPNLIKTAVVNEGIIKRCHIPFNIICSLRKGKLLVLHTKFSLLNSAFPIVAIEDISNLKVHVVFCCHSVIHK